jgi:hypothetical protein
LNILLLNQFWNYNKSPEQEQIWLKRDVSYAILANYAKIETTPFVAILDIGDGTGWMRIIKVKPN